MLLLLTEVRAACVSSRNRLQRVAGIAETVKGSTRHETTLLSHFLGVGPSVGPARIAVAPDPSSLGRDASFVGTTAEAVARAQARRLSRARLRGASTMSHAISLEPGPPSPRQCGRCRSVFPGDTVLDPSAAPKWWACAGCRRALFPRAPRKVQPRQRVSVRPGQDGDVSPSWFVEGGERDERAQRVARCSIELAARSASDEIGEVALELMRAGDHDPATLRHALAMCRSLSRDDPTDPRVKRAIRLLQDVTEFLGVPPHLFDARRLTAPDVAVGSAPVS